MNTTTSHDLRHDADVAIAIATGTAIPVRVVFDDSPFVSSHMSSPRGRGSWAFADKRNPDVLSDKSMLWSPSMTFGEAKKWAKQQVQAMPGVTGTVVLFVQP